MQIAQSGNLENIELAGRLKLGGRWYGRAQVVAVDSNDAAVLKSRGIAVAARKGAKPANMPEETKIKTQDLPVTVFKETSAHVIEMPVETETSKDGHGKRDKRR